MERNPDNRHQLRKLVRHSLGVKGHVLGHMKEQLLSQQTEEFDVPILAELPARSPQPAELPAPTAAEQAQLERVLSAMKLPAPPEGEPPQLFVRTKS